MTTVSLPDALSFIVDNRGRTCPTASTGLPLIATNCLKPGKRSPVFENVRYVDDETNRSWFRAHPEPGDVLFVCKGSPGRVAVVPNPVSFCIAQDMVALRANPAVVNPMYLYYRLSAPDVQASIGNMHVGTMIPHFKKGDFDKLKFAIHPSLSEQRAIAEVLSALDDKIAANQSVAVLADQLIEAHYAKALSAPGMSTQPLFEVIDVVFGEAFKGDQFADPGTGRPLIRIRDLKTASPKVWTTEERPNETLIQPGDVVVGMDAEFRASWWLGEPALLNQRVLRATPTRASIAFAAVALRRPLATLEAEKSATTVIHLNKADLARASVDVPGDDALRLFDEVAEPVRKSRVAIALETRKVASARDELLPLLMSGKLHVKHAEKSAEGVL
jgi:type I restriction enzyme, S subunit